VNVRWGRSVDYLQCANNTPEYLQISSSSGIEPEAALQLDGTPEPNPFTPDQFGAWRGMLRVHAAVFRALDRALLADHGFGVDAYGVLITLVTPPDGTLTIGELGEQRNLSPSGVSRSVDRLAKIGLVERRTNPADGRSLLVGLTPQGLARLRAAQLTHHAVVRELLLDRLDERDLKQLGELWEKAMPGSVSSPVWPL
jgi:DNA-binding MarR family transcriptional regulator